MGGIEDIAVPGMLAVVIIWVVFDKVVLPLINKKDKSSSDNGSGIRARVGILEIKAQKMEDKIQRLEEKTDNRIAAIEHNLAEQSKDIAVVKSNNVWFREAMERMDKTLGEVYRMLTRRPTNKNGREDSN